MGAIFMSTTQAASLTPPIYSWIQKSKYKPLTFVAYQYKSLKT